MQEILDKISRAKTNSDLLEIAQEYEIAFKDVIHLRNVHYSKGTSCEGCKNIDRTNMFPCNECGIHNNHYEAEHMQKGF